MLFTLPCGPVTLIFSMTLTFHSNLCTVGVVINALYIAIQACDLDISFKPVGIVINALYIAMLACDLGIQCNLDI